MRVVLLLLAVIGGMAGDFASANALTLREAEEAFNFRTNDIENVSA